MNKTLRLADLQLSIMNVLWEQREATVATVRAALAPKRDLAYTTVGTMLAKMEEKGYVTHRNDGRVNVYRPKISRDRVSRTMVADLRKRLFDGDLAQMMCQALSGCDVTRQELAELKKLIRQKERELKDAD